MYNIEHMSNIIFDELEKRDIVFFARVLPNSDYYKILELSIVTINDKYCTGTDIKTKQTFLFDKKIAEEVLFKNRTDAEQYLNHKKKNIKLYIAGGTIW